MPMTLSVPIWLEPRGLNVIDLVGQVPEEHVKGAVIVYSGGNGILRYQSGMRTGSVVEIKVSITPRYFTSGQDTYTRVNCLGQPAAYDQWPSTVPASTMRLFANGQDITNKIESMSTIPAGQVLPTNNANGFYRYPEPPAIPVSLDNGVLPIPTNMGCTIITPGKLNNLTATFTVTSPPAIQVTPVGSETFSARSYIGVGNAGALNSLNTQMQRRFGERHDKFAMTPPDGAEFAFVNFPPTEMDPYAGVEPLNRPLTGGGTYRFERAGGGLSVDHVASTGLPLFGQWQDSDQSGNSKYLTYFTDSAQLASVEYFLPPGIPYDPCMTNGDCSNNLLDQINEATYNMTIYYYKVERTIVEGLDRIPLKMVGKGWSAANPLTAFPTMLSGGLVTRPTVAEEESTVYLLLNTFAEPEEPIPPDDSSGCPCGWFDANGRMVDIVTNSTSQPPICYPLTLGHNGQGFDPVLTPSNSINCDVGYYLAGTTITLTASPATGWQVASWSGTANDANTAASNSLTMPAANHTASVTYEPIPPTCFGLTLTYSGSGSDPVATPANSSGCTTGQYIAGAQVDLVATPASGWQIASWSGTANDASTATSNTLTMPAKDHTAGVTYSQLPSTSNSWTFMLYLAGDTFYLDNGTVHGALARAIQRLESSSNAQVKVVALIDGPNALDTLRVTFSPQAEYQGLGEKAMDNPQTLIDFVTGAKQQFLADHYYLAIADHANGLQGIAWDTTTAANKTALLTPFELEQALRAITDNGAQPLDILHYDGCSFGLLEVAAGARNLVRYMVLSQNIGWGVFAYERYRDEVKAETTAETLAKSIGQVYAARVGDQQYPYTVSALDLSRMDTALAAANQFASTLTTFAEANQSNRLLLNNLRSQSQKFESGGQPPMTINNDDVYVDLVDYAARVKQQSGDAALAQTADGVMNAVTGPQPLVIYESHRSGSYDPGNTTATCPESVWALDGAHGISVYYPPKAAGARYGDYVSGKTFPSFHAASTWRQFLESSVPALAPGEPIPEERPEPLAPCDVEGAAATPGSTTVYLPAVQR
jgi:hypothetical protein